MLDIYFGVQFEGVEVINSIYSYCIYIDRSKDSYRINFNTIPDHLRSTAHLLPTKLADTVLKGCTNHATPTGRGS